MSPSNQCANEPPRPLSPHNSLPPSTSYAPPTFPYPPPTAQFAITLLVEFVQIGGMLVSPPSKHLLHVDALVLQGSALPCVMPLQPLHAQVRELVNSYSSHGGPLMRWLMWRDQC